MADYDVTALDSAQSLSSGVSSIPVVIKVDDTHALAAWAYGPTATFTGLRAQVFSINASTGVVAAISSPLTISPAGISNMRTDTKAMALMGLSSTKFVVGYTTQTGGVTNAYLQTLTIDGSYVVTQTGTPLSYNTDADGYGISGVGLDGTHFLLTYTDAAQDGYADIFTVNTGTGAITASGSRLEFDTTYGRLPAVALISSTRAFLAYQGDGNVGTYRMLSINTGTWVVTATGSATTGASSYLDNSVAVIDSTHAVVIWAGAGSDGFIQAFSFDTTTGAITALSSAVEFDTGNGTYNSQVFVDATHTWGGWQGASGDGFTRTFVYNSGTGAMATAANVVEFDTADALALNNVLMDSNGLGIIVWQGTSDAGKIQGFRITIPAAAVAAIPDARTFFI